jgi:hypothetical protein
MALPTTPTFTRDGTVQPSSTEEYTVERHSKANRGASTLAIRLAWRLTRRLTPRSAEALLWPPAQLGIPFPLIEAAIYTALF